MIRIFLVDDHEIVREGLSVLLQGWGYAVVGEAGDISEAVVLIQKVKPDIVLLDLHLNGRSGLDLLTELKHRSISVRCIVLTMVAQPRSVADALAMGALGYVLKGAAGIELRVAIEAAAVGRCYLGPEVAQLAAQSFTQILPSDALKTLSEREKQVVSLVVKGMTSAEIGELLHLSPKTVATYRSRLMAKLSLDDVASLVLFAIRHNLIDTD